MCAHLAISAASEATGAMSGVCAVAVGALAGLIGLKVSFAAPPRAPKKRQPRNGVTERERPRCFCEPLGAEPMSIRSRLPRASVAKGPPGISFHSSEAADHLNCTRVSTGHWCGTGLKKAHLTVRVSLARLFGPGSEVANRTPSAPRSVDEEGGKEGHVHALGSGARLRPIRPTSINQQGQPAGVGGGTLPKSTLRRDEPAPSSAGTHWVHCRTAVSYGMKKGFW